MTRAACLVPDDHHIGGQRRVGVLGLASDWHGGGSGREHGDCEGAERVQRRDRAKCRCHLDFAALARRTAKMTGLLTASGSWLRSKEPQETPLGFCGAHDPLPFSGGHPNGEEPVARNQARQSPPQGQV